MVSPTTPPPCPPGVKPWEDLADELHRIRQRVVRTFELHDRLARHAEGLSPVDRDSHAIKARRAVNELCRVLVDWESAAIVEARYLAGRASHRR